jgi:hypothetical protein
MVIAAKFRGKCRVCSCTIARGDRIEWTKTDGAAHVACANPSPEPATERTAPCWNCQAAGGKFRAHGASTPVLCDACHEDCPDCAYQTFMRSDARCEHCRRRLEWDWQRKAARCVNCCPTCHGPMSRAYALKGYQCDSCANAEEGPCASWTGGYDGEAGASW